MLHTSLAGAAAHDNYAPCTIGDLTALGFDYWALGHVHKRQVHGESPWIVMPGIPQGRDIGEAGPKSATLLCVDNGTIAISEVPTGGIAFQRRDIDVSECGDEDALRDTVRTALRDETANLSADAAIMRIRLTGTFEHSWRVGRDRDRWTAEISDMARESGRLWVEKVELAFSEAPNQGSGGSATAELSAIMATLCDQGPFSDGLERMVADVLNNLPPRLRAELIPTEAAQRKLTVQLARDGTRRMEELMRGSSQ